MFGSKKSEIEKVLERFGIDKGTAFLRYFWTYYVHARELMKKGPLPQDYVSRLTKYIEKKHGMYYVTEYAAFMRDSLANMKLLRELDQANDKYYDKGINFDHNDTDKANESATLTAPKMQENPAISVGKHTTKDPHELGRNEARHITCKYEGRESMCPKDCATCAISVKTEGDVSLATGNISRAIELYLHAVEIEPRFAEAWCNLGNAYGMNHKYQEALAAFDKAISIDSRYGKALFGKAITLKNLDRKNEAIELAQIVNEFYPGNAAVIGFLADMNYNSEKPKNPEKKPVVVPADAPHKSISVPQVSSIIPKYKQDEWYKHCTFTASLWEITNGEPIKEVGTFANANSLKENSFYAPLFKIYNNSGVCSKTFTISCVIDGIFKKTWEILDLQNGFMQSVWLGNKDELSIAQIGIHKAEYFVNDYPVCTFVWCIVNQRNEWVFHLSSSATLMYYNNANVVLGKPGLSITLRDIVSGSYISPAITLTNNAEIDTPPFTLDCLIDNKTRISWNDCIVRSNNTHTYRLSESSAKPLMTKGIHSIVYSIMGYVVCKFDWSIEN